VLSPSCFSRLTRTVCVRCVWGLGAKPLMQQYAVMFIEPERRGTPCCGSRGRGVWFVVLSFAAACIFVGALLTLDTLSPSYDPNTRCGVWPWFDSRLTRCFVAPHAVVVNVRVDLNETFWCYSAYSAAYSAAATTDNATSDSGAWYICPVYKLWLRALDPVSKTNVTALDVNDKLVFGDLPFVNASDWKESDRARAEEIAIATYASIGSTMLAAFGNFSSPGVAANGSGHWKAAVLTSVPASAPRVWMTMLGFSLAIVGVALCLIGAFDLCPTVFVRRRRAPEAEPDSDEKYVRLGDASRFPKAPCAGAEVYQA
jgi:hypothetical protein